MRQSGGQRRIGRRADDFAAAPSVHRPSEPVRLAQDDVERDHSSAKITQVLHELGHHVAPPRPLPNLREALLVDGDDADAIGRGRPRGPPQEFVVCPSIQLGDGLWGNLPQDNDQGRRAERAQKEIKTFHPSPHADFDAAIPWLGGVGRRGHQQVGFAVGGYRYEAAVETGCNEVITNQGRAASS
jgi:hypothetical protein